MRYFAISAALQLLLSATIVGCAESDQTTTAPSVTDQVEATPVSFANSKCPIMGGKPTKELTAEYDGKTIGFCCDGCPQKWAALSEEEKAEKFEGVKERRSEGVKE
ncbi:hypothetical protein Q31b_57130 [Novipirellula aureliae]|uniref:YHS domain protein n=1 Tax=Novipirellula aureliae TaxID=2527966 RepID=A0A5C6DEV2_9BACT|nr:hypothetical protein [Novipirellula aureliae]TWU33656.1 hypothetical protein Q31b_57130 [Novipirellula aureliae]